MSIRSRVEIRSKWIAILGPIVVVAFAVAAASFHFTDFPSHKARQQAMVDPLFFQHTGWYILEGAVPYVDVWDVNPPISFGVTAVLAALAGGDMGVLHALSATLTTAVAAASVLLVGWVAYLVTDEDAAAVAAGLTMLVHPVLFTLPLLGVRSQFYALFFGAFALAVALRDQPFLAGVLAALSAGSWQSGAVFALLIVGIAYQRVGRTGALRAVAGGGVVTGAVVLTFAAADALVPMIVETVVAPVLAGSPYSLAEHVYRLLLVFGYGSMLLPVALYGWARAAVDDWRTRWWIPLGGSLLAVQVLVVDLDGATDVLLWLVFIALGVAITLKRAVTTKPALTRLKWAVVAVVVLCVLLGPAWVLGSPLAPPLRTMAEDAEPEEDLPISPADGNVPSMHDIYWDRMEPATCHYRLSWNEVRWIAVTDDRLDARTCGAWPDRIDYG